MVFHNLRGDPWRAIREIIYQVSYQPPSLEVLKRHADVAQRDISERWCLGIWLRGLPVRASFRVGFDTKGFFQSK